MKNQQFAIKRLSQLIGKASPDKPLRVQFRSGFDETFIDIERRRKGTRTLACTRLNGTVGIFENTLVTIL